MYKEKPDCVAGSTTNTPSCTNDGTNNDINNTSEDTASSPTGQTEFDQYFEMLIVWAVFLAIMQYSHENQDASNHESPCDNSEHFSGHNCDEQNFLTGTSTNNCKACCDNNCYPYTAQGALFSELDQSSGENRPDFNLPNNFEPSSDIEGKTNAEDNVERASCLPNNVVSVDVKLAENVNRDDMGGNPKGEKNVDETAVGNKMLDMNSEDGTLVQEKFVDGKGTERKNGENGKEDESANEIKETIIKNGENGTDVHHASCDGNIRNNGGMGDAGRKERENLGTGNEGNKRAGNAEGGRETEEPSLCGHYKRRCSVWFACCQKMHPCHRCHNHDRNCRIKNAKSKDAKLLKCLSCCKIQSFTENSQHCVECGIQFAEYYCQYCRQLTDLGKKPYHCSKCGICRVQSDRSYHCDTCNVCLDISLRDKHQCRENSAHEPCCICLEDAFTGCQILPCGHKVHKECARIMIRSGMRQCPNCNQSFAHLIRRAPKTCQK